jgi:hypothetical protein
MEKQMNRNLKIWLVIVVIAVVTVACLAAFWAAYTLNQPRENGPPIRMPSQTNPADFEFYYVAKTVVSTINIALLVVLVVTYVSIYMKTKSEFTIGLLIFAFVFLIKDLSSNPYVPGVFGFRLFGLGPFALLPDVLELIALSVLIYLSVEY